MSRRVKVYKASSLAGQLYEDEQGYVFQYDAQYLSIPNVRPVSCTLPLQTQPFHCNTMFPFFDGLIPEGWLLSVAQQTWKIDVRDRMGLLMTCCNDCIGDVSIVPIPNDDV